MPPNTISLLYDCGIPIALGIYAWLLAERKVGKKPGEDIQADMRMNAWAPRLRLLGSALIITSLLYAAFALRSRP
jgi:hypothetical protein